MTYDINSNPYKPLGEGLKSARKRCNETVTEVSGAVELDEATYNRIELGQERPSEDILLLLITHFGVRDDEAVKLWELAGYDQTGQNKKDENGNLKPLVMVVTADSRIIYSDNVQIVANPNGVILNFVQSPNGPYPNQTISRIGMSREQATNLLRILAQTLNQSNKLLGAPKKDKTKPTTSESDSSKN